MGVIAMKKTGLIMILMLSAAVLFGCAEKKPPAQEAKEPASQSAESAGEKPAEIKEAPPAAAPAPAPEAKAVEENAPPPAAVEETPVKKEPAEVKGAAAGAAIYKSKCSPCHGPDGGGSVMAPAIKGNDWVSTATNADMAEVIKNGRQGAAKKYPNFVVAMPASKNMPEDDLNALVEYLKSIN